MPFEALSGDASFPPYEGGVISLKADRRNGEYFSSYAGQFFYCEAIDLPATIVMGRSSDILLSSAISSGYQVNAPFRGFTLFHDNYSAGGYAGNFHRMVFYTSSLARAFNQYVNPSVQNGCPFDFPTVFPSVGFFVDFAIGKGQRFFNCDIATILACVADPVGVRCAVNFRDRLTAQLNSPTFTRFGKPYGTPGAITGGAIRPTAFAFAGSYSMTYSVRNLPIPNQTEYASVLITPVNGASITDAGYSTGQFSGFTS